MPVQVIEITAAEIEVGDMIKMPYGYDLVTEVRNGYRGRVTVEMESGPTPFARTSTVTVWRDVPPPVEIKRAPTSDVPTFKGSPVDWFDNAERITNREANDKQMGVWYIRKVKNAGGTAAGNTYNISTPTYQKPPTPQRWDDDYESEWVRVLYRTKTQGPAWSSAKFLFAEVPGGGAEKELWIRNKNGRWRMVEDGRVTVSDASMQELNPTIANIVEKTD